jgi:hypothetical protein
MKNLFLLSIIAVLSVSCVKETEKELISQASGTEYSESAERFDLTALNSISIGVVYQCQSKDVGGRFNSEITFITDSTFFHHFDRGLNYFSDFSGSYFIHDNYLIMKHKGNIVIQGVLSYEPNNPNGFVLNYTNGKTEVYYTK